MIHGLKLGNWNIHKNIGSYIYKLESIGLFVPEILNVMSLKSPVTMVPSQPPNLDRQFNLIA